MRAGKVFKHFYSLLFMKIKVLEEDFKVCEVKRFELKDFDDIEGKKYACFLMRKKGRNTLDVVLEVARRLRKRPKEIGFAGNKDKKAVTEQYVSVGLNSEAEVCKIESLEIENVSMKFVGWCDERINLGNLKGNKFEIVVRDLDCEKSLVVGRIKNLFGEQRFGVDSSNVEIGKSIVKRDFGRVCGLLGLEVDGKDFVNALRKKDLRELRLYVGAYQSWLWNKVAEKVDNAEVLEIVGFLSEFEDKIVKKVYGSILKEESVMKEDFLINQFKELSMEGDNRKLYMDVKNFSFEWKNDDIFEGKRKCKLVFELGKGSYATVFTNFLFALSGKDI